LAWRLALLGVGIGLFAGPVGSTLMAATPYALMGAASGTTGLARNLGFALGPALATAIWASSGYTLAGGQRPAPPADAHLEDVEGIPLGPVQDQRHALSASHNLSQNPLGQGTLKDFHLNARVLQEPLHPFLEGITTGHQGGAGDYLAPLEAAAPENSAGRSPRSCSTRLAKSESCVSIIGASAVGVCVWPLA
jgi:hypothetical protein